MLLRLIITEGPRKGEELVVRGEITLGRSKGDFVLRDSKASGKHARIYTNPEGAIVIEDLASSNGTFVNGIRLKSSILKVGDVITLGKTTMEVKAEATEEGRHAAEKGTWQEVIEAQLSKLLGVFETNPPPTPPWAAFRSPVTLEFTRGLQAGSSLTYGFGPRDIGKLCVDGLLFDPQAPGLAFTLTPSETGECVLSTPVASLFVNEEGLDPMHEKTGYFVRKLRNGDRISFGQTVIVIKTL